LTAAPLPEPAPTAAMRIAITATWSGTWRRSAPACCGTGRAAAVSRSRSSASRQTGLAPPRAYLRPM
jgi:hypothetical protein